MQTSPAHKMNSERMQIKNKIRTASRKKQLRITQFAFEHAIKQKRAKQHKFQMSASTRSCTRGRESAQSQAQAITLRTQTHERSGGFSGSPIVLVSINVFTCKTANETETRCSSSQTRKDSHVYVAQSSNKANTRAKQQKAMQRPTETWQFEKSGTNCAFATRLAIGDVFASVRVIAADS